MKIAVILSGCGVADGSEIHEAVITLLTLARHQISYHCLAPNIMQSKVINHLTHEEMHEQRNVLVEAARIARGQISDIATANPQDYDAAIFPGGFGAAANLSNFATQGSAATVEPHVLKFAQAMANAHKPLGFICIAPNLIPQIYGQSIEFTIGHDQDIAQKIEKMGAKHIDCDAHAIVIDQQHRVVTTPAYMLGKNPAEIATGIEHLVEKVIQLCGAY